MAMERWRPQRRITPWSPWKEMEEMEQRFEDLFRQPFLRPWRRFPVTEREWVPAIDVFEKDDRFIVKAELPGMREEDVDVSVVGDTLNIKGERKTETEVKEEDYYCCERSYGGFFRSIGLPSNVDADKIEANYEEGVLEVSLPKTAEVKPTKIPVSTKKKASPRKGKAGK